MISNEALERLARGYDEPLSISTLAGELIATRNQLETARNESSLLRERARHYDRDWSSIRGELDGANTENAALHAECDRLIRYLGKVPNKDAEESYDLIDRYLRNNLDDPEYATMSAALEACYRTLLCPQNDRLTAMLGAQK